jgi:peptidoglycan/LPS O-acetylase OafA/YrhL
MQITHFSALPYFLIMLAVITLAWLIVKRSDFYKKIIDKELNNDKLAPLAESKSRYDALDGLRGILAISVLFQHAVTNYAYFSTGVWQITDVRFYRHIGGESVILFFMITSFLYWSKAIASRGHLDIHALYRSRFLRLAPMYLFSALLVTLFAFAQMNFVMISPIALVRDVLSWLSLGIVTTTSVNGISIIPINAGIHWTLHFEWIFYLLLPITALVLRHKVTTWLALPVFMAFLIFFAPDWGYWIIFLFGVAAAHVINIAPVSSPKTSWIKSKWMTLAPVIGVVLVYMMQHEPYSFAQYCVTFLVLLVFIYGNTLCGLLRTRALVFLGTISYSVYLMHGIVLFIVLHLANFFVKINTLSATSFWLLILISALLTVAISAVTYRYIEHEFLIKIKRPSKAVDPEVERVM